MRQPACFDLVYNSKTTVAKERSPAVNIDAWMQIIATCGGCNFWVTGGTLYRGGGGDCKPSSCQSL
jgi:hypothetical protein